KVNGKVNRIFVDAASNKLYLTSILSNVFVIDLEKDAIDKTIEFNGPIYAIDTDPTTNKVYMSSSGSNKIYIINTFTHKVMSTLQIGNDVSGISVDANNDIVYVANNNSKGMLTITKINTANNHAVQFPTTIQPKTNKFCAQKWPVDVQVNPNTGDAYIHTPCQIFKLSHYTPGVISPIANGSGIYALGVDPQTNSIYVANEANNTVSVINGSTSHIMAKINVGKSPVSIAVGKDKIYVANQGNRNIPGTISVINGRTNRLTTTIPLGGNPVSVAINTNDDL